MGFPSARPVTGSMPWWRRGTTSPPSRSRGLLRARPASTPTSPTGNCLARSTLSGRYLQGLTQPRKCLENRGLWEVVSGPVSVHCPSKPVFAAPSWFPGRKWLSGVPSATTFPEATPASTIPLRQHVPRFAGRGVEQPQLHVVAPGQLTVLGDGDPEVPEFRFRPPRQLARRRIPPPQLADDFLALCPTDPVVADGSAAAGQDAAAVRIERDATVGAVGRLLDRPQFLAGRHVVEPQPALGGKAAALLDRVVSPRGEFRPGAVERDRRVPVPARLVLHDNLATIEVPHPHAGELTAQRGRAKLAVRRGREAERVTFLLE